MQNSLISLVIVIAICFMNFDEHFQAEKPKEITNSIGMKLVLIPNGEFLMGKPIEGPRFDNSSELQHVTISKDFYLGTFEVTQAQYQKVMGKNPSHFQGREIAQIIPEKVDDQTDLIIEEERIIPVDSSNHPVESVTWKEAVEFCKRLSELPEEKKAGRVYRLPTEAEWEYACRAGSNTSYSFGDNAEKLGDYAWWGENSDEKTHPVGVKKPNAWGLYDLHGNVKEWCSDKWIDRNEGGVDPTGPTRKTSFHVIRCGGWQTYEENMHNVWDREIGGGRNWEVGFRVALPISPCPPE